ncbi:hypothetical protein [Algoriphagus sp.]|uniref:Spy/CpxP family protein refolding chaperone n=1 Tax=Algoriphagus sp. TaxID=1872435 RepID=UPI00391CDC56
MIKRILFLLFFLTASLANAQDMFQEYLYSADLVMKNREKISLTDDQANKIKKIHSTNAADFSTLKWDLDAETEKLKKLLAQSKPDPAAVTKQMDLVLNLENQLKKKQLSTLVAIKNELTENQQKTLKSTKNWTVYGTTNIPSNISPTLQSTSPKYRVGTSTSVKGIASVKGSESGYFTSKVSPEGDVTIYPDGGKIYFQPDPSKENTNPIYYTKNKNGTFEQVFDVQSIDPKNIESLEVLKGETASIRFGEKGKNGIIIFTLKDK